MEEFRDVKGYEGLYEVSNIGRLKSLARKNSAGRRLKGRMLKLSNQSNGYLNVGLSKNGTPKTLEVHQLVAVAFLGHEPCGHKIVVDHIDNNKLNNKVENLQLTTNRNNASKDRKGCSSKYTGVSWNEKDKRWKSQMYIDGKLKYLGYFTDELQASRAYQSALRELV
tara:strand:+ start:160 stop:660 length:501 start_codon:yes stop_codon:yes gene_type:complete